MLIGQPLSGIFGGSRARVLDVLLDVSGAMTVRQIARLGGIAPTSASIALRELRARHVVVSRRVGAALQFEINPDHYAVSALRALTAAAREADREFVKRLLKRLGTKPVSAVLFGSVARGEDRPDSDVDVLVVAEGASQADRWRERATDIASELSRWLGRTVNLQIAARPRGSDLRRPFWREVLRDGRTISGERVEALATGSGARRADGRRSVGTSRGSTPGKRATSSRQRKQLLSGVTNDWPRSGW